MSDSPYGGGEYDDRASWVRGYRWALAHLSDTAVQTDLRLLHSTTPHLTSVPLSPRDTRMAELREKYRREASIPTDLPSGRTA